MPWKNRTSISRQRSGKHAYDLLRDGVFRGVCSETIYRGIPSEQAVPCVEAGSNTSTVTLRVVGGDETESLKSETVKYGRES
jgi:hypothetical protein